MDKSDQYLVDSVAPLFEQIFSDSKLSLGRVHVDNSGFHEELQVWIEIPLTEKSHIALRAWTSLCTVHVDAWFQIDPLDNSTVLVDGRTPHHLNALSGWEVSKLRYTKNPLDPATSNLDRFLQANAGLRIVWDAERIIELMERNHLGDPKYVEGIRSRWEITKGEVEQHCDLIWHGYAYWESRAKRWED